MFKSARSRYVLAAAFWVGAGCWIVLAPEVYGMPTLLVGAAIALTVMAAVLERDERAQQMIRLAWWAGSAAGSGPLARIPRQEPAPVAEARQAG